MSNTRLVSSVLLPPLFGHYVWKCLEKNQHWARIDFWAYHLVLVWIFFKKFLPDGMGIGKNLLTRVNHHPPVHHPLDTVMTWVHSHLYEDIDSNSQQYEGYWDSSTFDILFLFSKVIALSALLSCTNMLSRNCFTCDIDFWFPFPKVENLYTHVKKCHVVSS